jgi:hypothetical protein
MIQEEQFWIISGGDDQWEANEPDSGSIYSCKVSKAHRTIFRFGECGGNGCQLGISKAYTSQLSVAQGSQGEPGIAREPGGKVRLVLRCSKPF